MSSQEQSLIENLIIESIKIYGIDVHYLPKTLIAKDDIYGEDAQSEYNKNYYVEMYIKNVEGFAGQGDFLSKFNVEIRDEITLTIARRTFEDEIAYAESFDRPREGDLIFLPLNNKIFQVKFVEHEPVFYQMGALQMYDLKCELFEYSNERFATGIELIDNLEEDYSTATNIFALMTESDLEISDEYGYPILNENYNLETVDVLADNTDLEIEADTFLDFTELNPFSEDGTF